MIFFATASSGVDGKKILKHGVIVKKKRFLISALRVH